jgi:SUMO ligase MMS21 Smc5/6 complex component
VTCKPLFSHILAIKARHFFKKLDALLSKDQDMMIGVEEELSAVMLALQVSARPPTRLP